MQNKQTKKNFMILIMLITLFSSMVLTACQGKGKIEETSVSESSQLVNVSEKNMTQQQNVFKEFWTLYDRYYPLFNRKDIDWKSVYDKYSSLITKDTTDDMLFEYFKEIMASINDGHSHLMYNQEKEAGAVESEEGKLLEPLLENTKKQIDFEAESVENPYLSYGTVKGHPAIGFILSKRFEPMKDNEREFKNFKKIVDLALDTVKDKSYVIIDVRTNGGGQGSYAFYLAGRFFEKSPIEFMRKRVKIAPGNDPSAFGDWLTQEIRGNSDSRVQGGYIGGADSEFSTITSSGDYQYSGEVIVLTSSGTASAAEYFTLAMKTQPKVTTLGTGTCGIFAGSDLVTLKNGNGKWVTNISVQDVEFKVNGKYQSFEGIGIAPDIPFEILDSEVKSGKDNQLEKAVEYLLNTSR